MKKFRFSCVSCFPNPVLKFSDRWINGYWNGNVKAIFVIWNLKITSWPINNCSDLILCLFLLLILLIPWCENVFAESVTAAFSVLSIFSFKLRRHKDTLFASDFHCFSWWMEINNSFAVRDFLCPLGPYSSFPRRKTCQVARIYIWFLVESNSIFVFHQRL